MFQVLPIGLLLILLKKVIVFVTLQFTLRHSETLWDTLAHYGYSEHSQSWSDFPDVAELPAQNPLQNLQ